MSTKTKSKRNSLEKDRRKKKVDHAQIDNIKGALAFIINYAFVWVLGLTFYFAISYPIRFNDSNYLSNKKIYEDTRVTYSLNMWNGASNEELMAAMEYFYLDAFRSQVEEKYNSQNGTNFTAEHIYNIRIYHLPTDPNPSNFQTEYFSYVIKEDGSVNPDVLATPRTDELNPRGLESLHSIIFSSYLSTEIVAREFIPEYGRSIEYLNRYDGFSKLICFAASMVIYQLILPLIFGYGRSLGELIIGLGYANKGNGYAVSYFKLPLRMLILSLPALIGTYFWNLYFLVIFLIFPYFLDLLFRLFSVNRGSIADKFLFIVPVDMKYERLYKNEAELLQDGETVLMGYSEEYTSTLSNVETMSLEDRGDGAH